MDRIYTKARAKINLTLNILDKRPDNYHNLESIFQKINFYDELYIEKTNTGELELKTNLKNVKLQDNIIYKAYLQLKEKSTDINGIRVVLNKKIPTEAGLAGGSTDCASFILAVNRLYKLNLSNQELLKIGKSLGADVCPCYYNVATKVEGIGEIITPISTKMKYYILIIKPRVSYSTKDMFNKLDTIKYSKKNEVLKAVEQALETSNLTLLCNNLYNVFEEIIEGHIIKTIKNELTENRAMRCINDRFRLMRIWNI